MFKNFKKTSPIHVFFILMFSFFLNACGGAGVEQLSPVLENPVEPETPVEPVPEPEPSPEPEPTPEPETALELNVRIHLMQGDSWDHPLGAEMNSWVTARDVEEVLLPEINTIFNETGIVWNLEDTFIEPYVEHEDYANDVTIIMNADRDEGGGRVSRLYGLMDPEFMSPDNELDGDLFHIYIFPFIGNTYQGYAIPADDYSVVSSWTNKFNGGRNPQKTYLVESQTEFVRGSLARTISHELGHILGLNHDDCEVCLMKGGGYRITEDQISTVTEEALRRLRRK